MMNLEERRVILSRLIKIHRLRKKKKVKGIYFELKRGMEFFLKLGKLCTIFPREGERERNRFA